MLANLLSAQVLELVVYMTLASSTAPSSAWVTLVPLCHKCFIKRLMGVRVSLDPEAIVAVNTGR